MLNLSRFGGCLDMLGALWSMRQLQRRRSFARSWGAIALRAFPESHMLSSSLLKDLGFPPVLMRRGRPTLRAPCALQPSMAQGARTGACLPLAHPLNHEATD
jgi:hypothetical protein